MSKSGLERTNWMELTGPKHEVIRDIHQAMILNTSVQGIASAVLALFPLLDADLSGAIVMCDFEQSRATVIGTIPSSEVLWNVGWVAPFEYWGIRYRNSDSNGEGETTDDPATLRTGYVQRLDQMSISRHARYNLIADDRMVGGLIIGTPTVFSRSLLSELRPIVDILGTAMDHALFREKLIVKCEAIDRRLGEFSEIPDVASSDRDGIMSSIPFALRTPLLELKRCLAGVRDDRSTSLSSLSHKLIDRSLDILETVKAVPQAILDYQRMCHSPLSLNPISLNTILSETILQLEPLIKQFHVDLVIEGMTASVSVNHMGILLLMNHLIAHAITSSGQETGPRVRIWSSDVDGDFVRVWIQNETIEPGYDSGYSHTQSAHFIAQELLGRDSALRAAIVEKGVERMGGRYGAEVSDHSECIWLELHRVSVVSTTRTQIIPMG